MLFEHRTEPLLPIRQFIRRMVRYAFYSSLILFISLAIGLMGYHFIGKLSWIDSLLNASMILTGMGPVNRMVTDEAKLFASAYALFSGIAFLSTATILFTPVAHRILHIVHLDQKEST